MRRNRSAVWLSAVLVGVGFGLTLRGLELDWANIVVPTGIIGVSLLTVWLVMATRATSGRIALWEYPVAALAQAAMVASGVAASLGLGVSDAYLAWMVLTALDMLAIGVVATLTAAGWMAFVSAGLAPVVVGLGIGWLQLGAEQTLVWLAAMVAAGVAASVVTRIQSARPTLARWVWPAHLVTLLFGGISVLRAVELLATRDVYLVGSLVALFAGGYLLANRALLASVELDAEWLSAFAFVTSATLLAVSLTPQDRWAVPTLIGIAVVGVVAAGMAGLSAEQRRIAWLIAACGFTIVASVDAVALFGAVSAEFGWILVVNGGAFAAYALTARQVLAMHLAVVTWLAAVLILVEHRWTLELHATVLSVSIVLLIMIEVERYRRRREGLDIPSWLRIAEWVVTVIPLALAAREMITTSLAYGLLLGAEGFALLAWGTLSRVRRRAMLGLAAITAAVLMAVMIPLIQGASQNLTGGWWLVIGGVAGVVFIAAGSLIEKYRTRVGDRLTEWGEIIERWE
jgi:hypothetical protein